MPSHLQDAQEVGDSAQWVADKRIDAKVVQEGTTIVLVAYEQGTCRPAVAHFRLEHRQGIEVCAWPLQNAQGLPQNALLEFVEVEAGGAKARGARGARTAALSQVSITDILGSSACV